VVNWGLKMGLQWGTAKKHAAIGKKAINNNRIVASLIAISGVDIY